MEPPDVIDWGYSEPEVIDFRPVVTDMINASDNKAHLLLMLKKYNRSDSNSKYVRNLITERLKKLRG